MTAMILTGLTLLFAVTLFAGVVVLLDCAVRGQNAYRALTAERSRRDEGFATVTVTQFVPRALTAANTDAMPAPLRAAA